MDENKVTKGRFGWKNDDGGKENESGLKAGGETTEETAAVVGWGRFGVDESDEGRQENQQTIQRRELNLSLESIPMTDELRLELAALAEYKRIQAILVSIGGNWRSGGMKESARRRYGQMEMTQMIKEAQEVTEDMVRKAPSYYYELTSILKRRFGR